MTAEILIIDDNSDIRLILDELIKEAGYKTRIAANYNQALKEIDKKIPDVAIIDVKLDKGDNDGIELLTHIKSKNKDVPVIIITGTSLSLDFICDNNSIPSLSPLSNLTSIIAISGSFLFISSIAWSKFAASLTL